MDRVRLLEKVEQRRRDGLAYRELAMIRGISPLWLQLPEPRRRRLIGILGELVCRRRAVTRAGEGEEG